MRSIPKRLITTLLCLVGSYSAQAGGHVESVCLITPNEANPFYHKMKEGAQAASEEQEMALMPFFGKSENDHESQVAAIETCVAAGARGILLAAASPSAIVPAVQQARGAGVLVVALDRRLSPQAAADLTIASNDYLSGMLAGSWAAAALGQEIVDAKVALLNVTLGEAQWDVDRNQGFLDGLGIDNNDFDVIGDEVDNRIVGNEMTNGNAEGGRIALESLLARDPNISLVFATTSSAATGAHEALKAIGLESETLIVSIGGSCRDVSNVANGVLDATVQEYPMQMAVMGVEAVKNWIAHNTLPQDIDDMSVVFSGVALVESTPLEKPKPICKNHPKLCDDIARHGISAREAEDLCWG